MSPLSEPTEPEEACLFVSRSSLSQETSFVWDEFFTKNRADSVCFESSQSISRCFHSTGLGVGALLLNATPVPSAFSEGLFSPSHRALQANSFCRTKEC